MDQLITLTQAATQLGCSRATVISLIERGQLVEFRSLLDRRARLVRAEDVSRLQRVAVTQLTHQPPAATAA